MEILVTYFSQTNNTEKIARAIYEETAALGHNVNIREIDVALLDSLNGYDLVIIGSACHDSDLAEPVKQFLDGITPFSALD